MDSIIDKIVKKIKNLNSLSVKKALFIYIILAVIITIMCSVIVVNSSKQWINLVVNKYLPSNADVGGFSYVIFTTENEGNFGLKSIEGITYKDKIILFVLEILKNYSSIIIAIVVIIYMLKIFYKNKFMQPINMLLLGTEYIANGDLTQDCVHEYNDEMGKVCDSFNRMRKVLINNQKETWNTVNEERRLKAAFMHDIRTPLTVLKGYNDLLLKFIPDGKITKEKLIESLKMMDAQLQRLDRYTETMKKVNSIEELQLNCKSVNTMDFINHVNNIIKGISEVKDKSIILLYDNNKMPAHINIDEQFFNNVLENLISNACRYSKKSIEIKLEYDHNSVFIYVKDDGPGFTNEDLSKACNLYYSTVKGDNHFGLGLYICTLLTNKHGGKIRLNNSIEKGAIVEASFKNYNHLNL